MERNSVTMRIFSDIYVQSRNLWRKYQTSINKFSNVQDTKIKKGFKDTVKQHINDIKDSHKTTKLYEVINKQITSSYTYKDLHELLLDIYSKHKCPYKINLGMGYILYNIIEKQYKYHYVSTNNLLFDYAQTIANKKDINKLMKRIISLDLATTYYFKPPNSNYTMGGLIHLEIRIFNLNGTLG